MMINYKELCELIEKPYVVILDANVLLDLYRFPPDTSMDIIDLLKQKTDNLLIPYQAYQEFIDNSNKVKGNAKKKYKTIETDIKNAINHISTELVNKTNGYRRYNYSGIEDLQEKLNKEINDMKLVIKEYMSSHNLEIKKNETFINDDSVYDFIEKLKSDKKIGLDISYSEKLQILSEGKLRYENLLPPGYEDCDKSGIDKYGDLLVWKEVLKYSQNNKKNIIFVTNDRKGDWWELDKRENPIKMRNELEKEFSELNPNIKITFLTLDVFYKHMAKFMKSESLNTTLMLELDSYMRIIEKNSELNILIREELKRIPIESEINYYVGGEITNLEYISDEWEIIDATISIKDNYAFYYFELNVELICDVYTEFNISAVGEAAFELNGKVIIKREIDDNNICEEEFNIEKIELSITNLEYKDIFEEEYIKHLMKKVAEDERR